jgi:hypothetical protein
VSDIPNAPRIGVGLQDHLFFRGFYDGPHLYDETTPDVAVLYVPSTAQDSEQWEVHAPGRRLFTIDDGTPWRPIDTDGYQLMIRSFVATEKRDSNRVEAREGDLGSSTIHFSYSETDVVHRARIQEKAKAVARVMGLQPRDERFAEPGGSYHEAGGLDMGTDPDSSVTTSTGAFHHISNVICVDAAAFPRIGATNPHLTIVAIARRQAEALATIL